MGEIIGFRFGSVDKFAEVMKPLKKQKRRQAKKVIRLEAPNGKPMIELAEEVFLTRAVQAATRGAK